MRSVVVRIGKRQHASIKYLVIKRIAQLTAITVIVVSSFAIFSLSLSFLGRVISIANNNIVTVLISHVPHSCSSSSSVLALQLSLLMAMAKQLN